MIYMAINNLITKQKNNILVYINIAVGMMGALLSEHVQHFLCIL